MTKPTGKLLFAYQTIARMEAKIEDLKMRVSYAEYDAMMCNKINDEEQAELMGRIKELEARGDE